MTWLGRFVICFFVSVALNAGIMALAWRGASPAILLSVFGSLFVLFCSLLYSRRLALRDFTSPALAGFLVASVAFYAVLLLTRTKHAPDGVAWVLILSPGLSQTLAWIAVFFALSRPIPGARNLAAAAGFALIGSIAESLVLLFSVVIPHRFDASMKIIGPSGLDILYACVACLFILLITCRLGLHLHTMDMQESDSRERELKASRMSVLLFALVPVVGWLVISLRLVLEMTALARP